MRITKEKKNALMLYALEIIDKGYTSVAEHISEVFDVDRSTAYRSLKQLSDQGLIQKVSRGSYQLTFQEWNYTFSRSRGELDSDLKAYKNSLESHIQNLPENVVQIWMYVFTEMINNVMDHSGSETASVRIRQNMLKTTVMITDQGIGIFEKIKSYFGFSETDEAIEELFKGKLTTDKEHHSGEGIFFSSRLMDEFIIMSGTKIFSCDHFDQNKIWNLSETVRSGGTAVYMCLANNSSKLAREIFDSFTDEDGNFIKTTIPIKNVFNTYPVSRSQAKRLSNRFAEFKEVTLDFEDVEWIGQGFADQLFRVFQNENPEIRLLPVNMNESVQKMIHHVAAGK